MQRPAWSRRRLAGLIRMRPTGIAAVVLALGIVGAGAYAAIPDTPGGTIHVLLRPGWTPIGTRAGPSCGIIDKARNPRGCDSRRRRADAQPARADGATGPAGPTGATGPVGPAGPTGGTGPRGRRWPVRRASRVRRARPACRTCGASTSTSPRSSASRCPPGHTDDAWTFDCGAGSEIISGGAYIEEEVNPTSPYETKIDESGALDARRWRVRIRNVGDDPVHDHATFLCADPPGQTRRATGQAAGLRSARRRRILIRSAWGHGCGRAPRGRGTGLRGLAAPVGSASASYPRRKVRP